MDAAYVHLERPPPVVQVDLPRRAARVARAGVRNEQVDRPKLGEPALDVLAARHVAEERPPSDRRRDALDLLRGASADGDLHPGGRELPRDAFADPTTAAGHECPLSR